MNRKILDLAVPNIISNISIPLLGFFLGMRNAMLLSTLLVFFPAYLILNKLMGNHGLWLAFILFMLARSITMAMMAKRAVFSKVS